MVTSYIGQSRGTRYTLGFLLAALYVGCHTSRSLAASAEAPEAQDDRLIMLSVRPFALTGSPGGGIISGPGIALGYRLTKHETVNIIYDGFSGYDYTGYRPTRDLLAAQLQVFLSSHWYSAIAIAQRSLADYNTQYGLGGVNGSPILKYQFAGRALSGGVELALGWSDEESAMFGGLDIIAIFFPFLDLGSHADGDPIGNSAFYQEAKANLRQDAMRRDLSLFRFYMGIKL